MQLLRDVAQAARYQAMQPGQITQHYREQDADLQAFERASTAAKEARMYRKRKAEALAIGLTTRHHSGRFETMARMLERRVREIALQSEIILQRRFEMAQADHAMLRAMMAEAA